MNIRVKLGKSSVLSSLPERKRGRSKLISNDIDEQVQLYVRNVREGGGSISARVVMGAAQGILKYYGKEDLAELINRQWAYSLLKRMKFVRRKATTSKSKYTFADFAELKKSFLRSVVETVTMEEISPQLVLNWDQAGINIIPSSSWTLEEKGSKRIELVGIKDKRQITAIFCCSIQGDFLPVKLIGASLSEPHTNDIFVRWFVRGKTAVKSGMPHTTVSLVGWFKHYNTRKITLNPYKCVCDMTKTVLELLVLHKSLYGGSG